MLKNEIAVFPVLMKILILSASDVKGGAAKVGYLLAKGLIERNHEDKRDDKNTLPFCGELDDSVFSRYHQPSLD